MNTRTPSYLDLADTIELLAESLHYTTHKSHCDMNKQLVNARCTCGFVGFVANVKRHTNRGGA